MGRTTELFVGIFMVLGIVALAVLAVRVSGLTLNGAKGEHYVLHAHFDNVGGLKTRQPVRIGGVKVGFVQAITLNPKTYHANVEMLMDKSVPLAVDTEASILTEGILGSQYISLTPGFDESYFGNGDVITETHSALILEEAIGKFLFNSDADGND